MMTNKPRNTQSKCINLPKSNDLTDVLNALKVGIFILTSDKIISFINCEGQRILGKSSEQLLGEYFAYPLEENKPKEIVLSNMNTRHILLSYKKVDLNPNEVSWFVTIIDLSQIDEANREKAFSKHLLKFSSEAIMVTDLKGNITSVNHAFEKVTGFKKNEVIHKNAKILSSGYYEQQFFSNIFQELKHKGFWRGEMYNRNKKNEVHPYLMTISTVQDEVGAPIQYIGIIDEASPVYGQQEDLEHLGNHDSLTGLPNGSFFEDQLTQAVSVSQECHKQFAMALISINELQEINTTYGEATGNLVIQKTSERLKKICKNNDAVARYSGTEFAAILHYSEKQSKDVTIHKEILKVINAPIKIDDNTIKLKANVGIILYPQDKLNLSSKKILFYAREALIKAKSLGDNHHYQYLIQDYLEQQERCDLINEIEHALSHNELVLYYQPKVNLRNGAIVGVEALIRWNHPQKGLLLPGSFLPHTKGYDIVVKIDKWVLKHAIKQLHFWHMNEMPIKVSVNLSTETMLHNSFVNSIKSLLSTYEDELPPKSLEIEILEYSKIEDEKKLIQIIDKCNKLGITFSYDDFGIGFESLKTLKELPVNDIKIDRDFIINMFNDHRDLAILDSIFSLSNSIDKRVIAEGVCSLEHGQQLLNLGCEFGQGFFIAKPMPADELVEWYEKWQPPEEWQNIPKPSDTMSEVVYIFDELKILINCLQQKNKPFNLKVSFFLKRLKTWIDNEGLLLLLSYPVTQDQLCLSYKKLDDFLNQVVENELTEERKDSILAEANVLKGVLCEIMSFSKINTCI